MSDLLLSEFAAIVVVLLLVSILEISLRSSLVVVIVQSALNGSRSGHEVVYRGKVLLLYHAYCVLHHIILKINFSHFPLNFIRRGKEAIFIEKLDLIDDHIAFKRFI